MSNSDNNTGMKSFKFYSYTPSLAAAVIFIVIFALSSIYHGFQLITRRTWYFIPFFIGCLFETIGYVGRVLSSREAPDFTEGPFIIQSLLLLLGPNLYAASIYMILGRIIALLEAEKYSVIKLKWLTKFFVLGDVLSFLTQGGGAGFLASAKSANDLKTSEHIVLIGLAIQILFFGFFMIVTLVFHRRISQRPTTKSQNINAHWRLLIFVLYAASTLIMVRSFYRVAEYVTGQNGVLQSNEPYLYCLDSLPMFLVALLFNWFHPSRVVNREFHLASQSSVDVMDGGHLMIDRHAK